MSDKFRIWIATLGIIVWVSQFYSFEIRLWLIHSYNFARIIGFDCNLLQIRIHCYRAYEATVETLTWYVFCWSFFKYWSIILSGPNSKFGTVAALRKGRQRDHISNPGRDTKKALFAASRPALKPTQLPDQQVLWTQFHGFERSGRLPDDSSSRSVEMNNAWSSASTPPISPWRVV